MLDKAVELTKALISCPSVTPKDCGCQQIICGRLQPFGFKPRFISRGQTTNLWIRKGDQSPVVVFGGHTDVVPPGSGWETDPFTPVEAGGRIAGRGAQDMKTSDAAFAVAAERFVQDYPDHKGSIAMLLTSDEEGDGKDGTKYVVEELQKENVKADFCIVGEPTCVSRLGDTIKNGRRGSQNGRLTVKGIQGHVAYPEKVRNPIHSAAPLLAELVATEWDEGYPGFPKTSFQISNINAGTGAVNVVPGTCEILFNLRYSPALTAEKIENRIEEMCRKHGLDYEIDWQRSANPFSTKGQTLCRVLQESIREVCGDVDPQLSTSGGTSDARFISLWCPEVVEFGPINNLIHKANESVSVGEIGALAEIYYKVLVKLIADG